MKIDNYKIVVGNATDVGRIREYNEDYLAHFGTPYGYCVIVCDGMGGHAAGDVASQAAIEAIKHYLQDGTVTKLDTPNSIQNAIEFANYKLREMVVSNPLLSGMGTTCVMALFNNNEVYVAHAGDSRLYLIRNNRIKQISKDHSTVQQLIDAGAMTEEEAQHSNKRNQITKAIGIFEKVDPSVMKDPIQLKYNDKILLCSDGLTTHLQQTDIKKIIRANSDVQAAAMKLIENANAAGGSDNITVQLVEFKGRSISNVSHKKAGRKILKLSLFLALVFIGFLAYRFVKPVLIKKENQDNYPKDTLSKDKKSGVTIPIKLQTADKKKNKIDTGIIDSTRISRKKIKDQAQ